jgi:hypothetical protein
LYRRTGRREESAAHHDRALEHLEALVDSFEPDEPIRRALVDAAAVRQLRQERIEMRA